MKSKINSSDFFCFLEMISSDIELKMNILTYRKILGKTGGISDYASIQNIQSNINGVTINFDLSMKNDVVIIIANYISHTQKSFDIEIV